MYIQIHNRKVHYKKIGTGKPILFVHGWGGNLYSLHKLACQASKNYTSYLIDLPGFGKTLPPQRVWGVEEYVDIVNAFTQNLGLREFFLAGHSFGGQVSVLFCLLHTVKVRKLILMAAAAVRHNPGLRENVLRYLSKVISVFMYILPGNMKANVRTIGYKIIGRRDYLKAYGIMRDIFKKVIAQDLSDRFSKVKVPTLILWGRKDRATPIQDGEYMAKQIPGSKLVVFEGVGHRLNFEIPEKLSEIIAEFIRS